MTRRQASPEVAVLSRLVVRDRSIGIPIELARTPYARLRGWLGRRTPPPGCGLWLVPCDAVHTVGMRFALDLIFLDAAGRVLRIDHRVGPWRLRVCIGAFSVIELDAGMAEAIGLAAGDELELQQAHG